MKLIVGLGNPGEEYRRTRHNVGFRVVDMLAAQARATPWKTECLSAVCSAQIAGAPALLAKPLTYMNLSGRAVGLLMAEYRLGLPDLVVILDDFNLPLGKIRIRERGSAGGHNGLESVLRALESDEFVRIRLGIGEDNMPEDKMRFVLAEFPREREEEVNHMIMRAADAVRALLAEGAARAMSVFNQA